MDAVVFVTCTEQKQRISTSEFLHASGSGAFPAVAHRTQRREDGRGGEEGPVDRER